MRSSQQVLQRETIRRESDSPGKKFLVASDGRPDSDPAFQLANLLAGGSGEVRGVTVVDQVNLVPEGQLLFSAEVEAQRRYELWRRVHAQMLRVLGRPGNLELYDGDPARLIAQAAHRVGATMILAGIGRHGISSRLFGNETVLRIMRVSDLPVLAVVRDVHRLPQRIVAAVDFSESSIRALRLAISLAAPGATVSIAYVCPRDAMLYDGDRSYKENLQQSLNALKDEIEQPAGVVIKTALLQGDPSTELLAFAKSVDADLISCGSHGHGFIARLVIGSVTTRIIRGSGCSVLTVPRASDRGKNETRQAAGRALIPAHWSSLLDDVSRQNIGRMSTLEADVFDGATPRVQQTLLFMGATYDPHDGHAQLVFAERYGARNQVTHEVRDVTSIAVIHDESGRERTIRIGHYEGQTVLTFSSEALDFQI